MSKLIMVLTFTALAAFAFAHRPIITTTTTTTLIEELENSVVNGKKQCGQRLQGQTFNRCQTYITSSTQNCCLGPEGWGCYPCMSNKEGDERVQLQRQGMVLEECCNELRSVEGECQCRAMKEVYKQAQQQQLSQQSSQQDLQQIVQNLPNQCNLQVKQCRLPSAAMF